MRRISALFLLFAGFFLIAAGPKKIPPSFNPDEGTYEGEICVEIINNFLGSTIYYTTDGSDPTAESDVYIEQICLDTTTVIKAISIEGHQKSKVASAVYTINIISFPSPVPKTGQTTQYGAGDDGDLQAGVAWPNPRFTDNGDGTVTDNLTGLVWLKDAKRFEREGWYTALNDCNSLADDGTSLTDGSQVGDWRLPNVRELQSLIDYGRYSPALPQGHPFTNVQSEYYWTSNTSLDGHYGGWYVDLQSGHVNFGYDKDDLHEVWPVRGPE
jgi:hypothetical protein